MEARNRVGGRINTLYGSNKAPVEMGATWFTKQHKALFEILDELNIEYFEQKMDSKVFYEATQFPGYMEGAVNSANLVAEKIIKANKQLQKTNSST